jgi:hypothetical protein
VFVRVLSEKMQEQFDAVKIQLLTDDNADLRQEILSAYLEEPERGANVIVAFAKEKGLKLDASIEDVVQAMKTIDPVFSMDPEEIDIEMSPAEMANVSGAGFSCW